MPSFVTATELPYPTVSDITPFGPVGPAMKRRPSTASVLSSMSTMSDAVVSQPDSLVEEDAFICVLQKRLGLIGDELDHKPEGDEAYERLRGDISLHKTSITQRRRKHTTTIIGTVDWDSDFDSSDDDEDFGESEDESTNPVSNESFLSCASPSINSPLPSLTCSPTPTTITTLSSLSDEDSGNALDDTSTIDDVQPLNNVVASLSPLARFLSESMGISMSKAANNTPHTRTVRHRRHHSFDGNPAPLEKPQTDSLSPSTRTRALQSRSLPRPKRRSSNDDTYPSLHGFSTSKFLPIQPPRSESGRSHSSLSAFSSPHSSPSSRNSSPIRRMSHLQPSPSHRLHAPPMSNQVRSHLKRGVILFEAGLFEESAREFLMAAHSGEVGDFDKSEINHSTHRTITSIFPPSPILRRTSSASSTVSQTRRASITSSRISRSCSVERHQDQEDVDGPSYDPLGCYAYGMCLLHGHGVAQNTTEALVWLHRAAGLNEPQAMYEIAMCFKRGWIADDHFVVGMYDREEGSAESMVRWFKAAADFGHAASQFEVALCYLHGEGGLKRDKYTAAR
ncbi:Protein sel-1 3 [Quaeritorhiza haematococci]|nr:Protein sel-1 3 [Quaeritorhiza haematococci]